MEMKYEVITDAFGYVMTIRHTGTKRDFVTLDLQDYDFSDDRLFAYKLGKNELIFNEKRYKEIQDAKQKKADQTEIDTLKDLLAQTDYIMAEWGEEIISLDNPLTWVADVIKINLKYIKQYKQVLSNRKTWRARIKELEGD